MLCHKLRVEQAKATCAQMFHEIDQGNLAGVGRSAKHALASKKPTYSHPIEPANQFTFDPGFDAVGKAKLVQCAIGIDNVVGNPGCR